MPTASAQWQDLDVYKEEELVIDIVGVCTDICVITNALILKTYCPNATIRVISHLCAGTTLEKHKEVLSIMESCQVDIL